MRSAPTKVPQLAHAQLVNVSCGSEHTAVISEDGRIFTWGLGVFGALGHGNTDDQLVPKQVETLQECIQVACGSHHTICLTAQKQCFAFGHAEYGQTGTGDAGGGGTGGGSQERGHSMQTRPKLIQNVEKIQQVSCGHLHTLLLTTEAELLTFGWSSSGCLGHGNNRYQLEPRVVQALQGEKVVQAVAGWNNSYAIVASSATFAFDFSPLIGAMDFSDLIFIVEGGHQAFAHQVIVCSRSRVVAAMCALSSGRYVRGSATGGRIELILPKLRMQILNQVMNYIYTDQLNIPVHLASQVYHLASKWGLLRLAQHCQQLQGIISARLPSTSMGRDMLSAINCTRTTDLAIEVESERFLVHRSILCSRSEYFSTLLQGSFMEAQCRSAVHQLDTVSAQVLECILIFLYSSHIDEDTTPQVLFELLAASNFFLVHDLKQICEARLEKFVDQDNVQFMLDIAERYDAPRLGHFCHFILLENK
jgi:RCC1 and BTB domain-containing protein